MKKIILLLSILSVFGVLKAQKVKHFNKQSGSTDTLANESNWKKALGLSNDITLHPYNNKSSKKGIIGWEHKEYQLQYKTIPIEFAIIKVHKVNNKVRSINGEVYNNVQVNINPNINEQSALESALTHINAERYLWEKSNNGNGGSQQHSTKPKGSLVICKNYNDLKDTTLHLAYKFIIAAAGTYVYVDAHDGEVILTNSTVCKVGSADTRYSETQIINTSIVGGKYVLIDDTRGNHIETRNISNRNLYLYDGNNEVILDACGNETMDLDRSVWISESVHFEDDNDLWVEHDNTDLDDGALDAHWGMMKTYDYFKSPLHNRSSYDGNDAKVHSFVHYGSTTQIGAWWNWGDLNDPDDDFAIFADGPLGPTTSLDVVAHEFSHGICGTTAKLIYQGESGALCESFSDMMAACVENATKPKDIWRIGEDSKVGPGSLVGFRLMSDPQDMNHPDTYHNRLWRETNYTCTNDNGGVHYNSGVPNYWFYLLSEGGVGANSWCYNYDVTGIGIDNASKVIYKAVTEYMTPNTDFNQARNYTIQAAEDLFEISNPSYVQSVIDAWNAVGVDGRRYNSNFFLTITDPIPALINQQELFIGHYYVIASSVVETNADVIFRAENYINLNPGFEVEENATFYAHINECDNPSGYIALSEEENIIAAKPEDVQAEIEAEEQSELKPTTTISEISLYPNPTDNLINIEITNLEGDVTIAIYSFSGALIHSEKGSSAKTTIDLSDYEAGMYLVNISTSTLHKSIKVVKS